MPGTVGKVILVGAGPGDPGLITVRGHLAIQHADAILYDYLVNPQLLAKAQSNCQLICLGKHGSHSSESGNQRLWSQSEINARMIELAATGQTVVRLKSGDPVIFGRLAEECTALEQAAIPYEVVPGLTAALAASSYAGVWVTNREMASAVALITGHEQESQTAPKLDYDALAKFPGTLVFYMGVTTIKHWSAALIQAGKSPATPVVIVRRCSWPDQWSMQSTLAKVADDIQKPNEPKVRPPVIAIVGEVAQAEQLSAWFTERPLFGQRILVTRPVDQADSLAALLEEAGAECFSQPTITISPVSDKTTLRNELTRLKDYDWIVFSSSNGVDQVWQTLWENGLDARAFGRTKIAVIGPATAEALLRYQLRADLIPDEYRAEALADALLDKIGAAASSTRCLLIRASRGREILAEKLSAAGIHVQQVVAYESTDVTSPAPEIQSLIQQRRIDWITVTSSAIARSLVNLFGEQLLGIKLASISPITSSTLAELGYAPTVEAREYTMSGLVQAMIEYHR